MSEARLRQLERQWLEEGSPESAQAYASALRRRSKTARQAFDTLDSLSEDMRTHPSSIGRFLKSIALNQIPTYHDLHAVLVGHPFRGEWTRGSRAASLVAWEDPEWKAEGSTWGRFLGQPLVFVSLPWLDLGTPSLSVGDPGFPHYVPPIPGHEYTVEAGSLPSHGFSFAVPVPLVLLWANVQKLPGPEENPGEERVRRLERAAATGDVEAQARLLRERVRRGGLPIENVWIAAFFEGPQSPPGRAVGYVGPGDLHPVTLLVQFLSNRITGRPGDDWPLLSKRRQHTLSTAFAWGAAASVEPLARQGISRLINDAMEDPPEWFDEYGWRNAHEDPSVLVGLTQACTTGTRSLKRLRRFLPWNTENAAHLAWLGQEVYEGEIHFDPPHVAGHYNALEVTPETYPGPSWLKNLLVATTAVTVASYFSAVSALYACVSPINRANNRPLWIPASGWLRDQDLPVIQGRSIDALAYATYAFLYAVAARSVQQTKNAEDHEDPESQNQVWGDVGNLLVPRLLEGSL